jgi:hypothetical protein
LKILFSIDCGKTAWYFKALGLARAFSCDGHDVYLWDIDKKSEHDIFDEIEPDLFIGQTYRITPALIACFEERPYLKKIFKAGDWGSITEEVSSKYPILVATDQEKINVDKAKPDFLFIHYNENYINSTHGFWKDSGYRVESLMNAADTFEYLKGEEKNEYKCDIGYVGGKWPYKSLVLDPYILPLCSNFDYNIKVFGRGWSIPQYMGYLPEGMEKHFYSSCKINLCFHEPHSQEYHFDVTEKFFKLAINKSFTICDKVNGLEKLFKPKTVYSFSNPQDMHLAIKEILSDWDNFSLLRKEYVENAYNQVIQKHTYFDRAAEILSKISMEDESLSIIKKKKEILEL